MSTASEPRELRRDALLNQQQLVRAATAAIHREGLSVPMSTIAADAGVGIGTLYRRFPTREDLLNHLTHHSFRQVLANAQVAEHEGATPIDSLRLFVEAAISQRNQLVLPLHGGPPLTAASTLAVRAQVHRTLQRIIARGVNDGTIRPDLTPHDLVILGAMLAQPRPTDPHWDTTCRRLLATYLRGITR